MRVQFILPDFYVSGKRMFMGIALLSAVLREEGHKVLVTHIGGEDKVSWKEKVTSDIRRFRPEITCFTLTECEEGFLRSCSEFVSKEFGIPIVVGGPYATLCSKEVASLPFVDAVFFGEAENSLATFLRKLEKRRAGGIPTDTPGTVAKDKRGGLHFNRPAEPRELESLPFPDWSVFEKRAVVVRHKKAGGGNEKTFYVHVSRGCPFGCTFCSNDSMKKKGLEKGKQALYFRTRSPENIIEEIEVARKKYDFDTIGFNNDVFWATTEWLARFSKLYSEKVGLPFGCLNRVELINNESVRLLKNAGCRALVMGIESGSPRMRRKLLCRPYSNSTVTQAFSKVNCAGIETIADDIIGFPLETEEDVLKTLELTVAARPDQVNLSVFYPFKGTPLGDMCYRQGWVDLKRKESLLIPYSRTILDMPDFSQKRIDYWSKNFITHYYLRSGKYGKAAKQTAGIAIKEAISRLTNPVSAMKIGNFVKPLIDSKYK